MATDEGYMLDYEDYLETAAGITTPETLQFSTGDPDPSPPLDDAQEPCDMIEGELTEEAREDATVEATYKDLKVEKEEIITSTDES